MPQVGRPQRSPTFVGAKKSTQTFFVQSFSATLRVMDVRAENRGRPRRKVRFPVAPVVGRNFLTPGHPGTRVRNVRGKFGPKSLCLCCFFFPEFGGQKQHKQREKHVNKLFTGLSRNFWGDIVHVFFLPHKE